MKILLGGVPFGCDNIGDEAILASVIGVFRRICPSAELVVCTGDREGTERKFGLRTAPLYGFDPALPAARITESLSITTIGIGAGPHCDGQILVISDVLGLGGAYHPKFAKCYADLGEIIGNAARAYKEDVTGGAFPDEAHSYTS